MSNLEIETVKIAECHYPYNKKIKPEKTFQKSCNQNWKCNENMKNEANNLWGKKNSFQISNNFKIIYVFLTNSISAKIIYFLNKIQKSFSWKNSKLKIKPETLCKSCLKKVLKRGLKNVDILKKFRTLQCLYVQWLFITTFTTNSNTGLCD